MSFNGIFNSIIVMRICKLLVDTFKLNYFIQRFFVISGYLEGYSGSGHGWETYSGGRKSGESESGLGGWVEHSGNGQVWGENDDEDF